MKKVVIVVIVIAALAGVALYAGLFTRGSTEPAGVQRQADAGGPGMPENGRKGLRKGLHHA